MAGLSEGAAMKGRRTVCTVCGREVGVVSDWNRRQGQQTETFRVTRHRSNVVKVKGGRQEICGGTGLHVPAEVVSG